MAALWMRGADDLRALLLAQWANVHHIVVRERVGSAESEAFRVEVATEDGQVTCPILGAYLQETAARSGMTDLAPTAELVLACIESEARHYRDHADDKHMRVYLYDERSRSIGSRTVRLDRREDDGGGGLMAAAPSSQEIPRIDVRDIDDAATQRLIVVNGLSEQFLREMFGGFAQLQKATFDSFRAIGLAHHNLHEEQLRTLAAASERERSAWKARAQAAEQAAERLRQLVDPEKVSEADAEVKREALEKTFALGERVVQAFAPAAGPLGELLKDPEFAPYLMDPKLVEAIRDPQVRGMMVDVLRTLVTDQEAPPASATPAGGPDAVPPSP